MVDTINETITGRVAWASKITASSGTFSASKTCTYCIATSQPAEILQGHRLGTGDLVDYTLESLEEMYFKSDSDTTLIVTGEVAV